MSDWCSDLGPSFEASHPQLSQSQGGVLRSIQSPAFNFAPLRVGTWGDGGGLLAESTTSLIIMRVSTLSLLFLSRLFVCLHHARRRLFLRLLFWMVLLTVLSNKVVWTSVAPLDVLIHAQRVVESHALACSFVHLGLGAALGSQPSGHLSSRQKLAIITLFVVLRMGSCTKPARVNATC